MARPDRTEKFHPADTTVLPQRTTRALARLLRQWSTSPQRLTVIGAVLVIAGLVLAGLTTFGSGPTPAAVATHPPKPAPTTRHTPPAPPKAPPAPTVAQPDTTNTSLIRLHWGDTLWALAHSHDTTVSALQQLNGLGASTRIYAGQQLRVPTATTPPAGTPPAPTVPQPNPTVASVPTQALAAATSLATGIYAFSGGNSADLAGDPDVAGRSLVYYWGQLEPQPGVYRWDLVDQDMAPWVAAGKKVILRVATAGQASWDKAADSAHGTPAWVYDQGVKSVTERDGAVLPQYWNPTFLTDLHQFLAAFAAHYDGNPHVALVDVAVGIGGETKPDSENNPNLLSLWQGIGYTDSVWWSTVQQIITDYTTAFTHTPLALMPDKTFLGHTTGYSEATTLNYAVSKGVWLQDNGLLPGRTLPAPWGQTPVVSEQRNPATQDGNSLSAELQAARNDGARIVLVFTADLTDPADQAIIHQFATGDDGSTGAPACGPGPVRTTPATTDAIMCPLTNSTTTPTQTTTTPGHDKSVSSTSGTAHSGHARHTRRAHHRNNTTGRS